MISLFETLAIRDVTLKSQEYFQRKICRYYSEKFHTPLVEVYSLPWSFVLTNYLEHVIETNNTKDDLYDLAIDICYPEKRDDEEKEIQEWIKKIEKEQAEELSKKKSPHTKQSTKSAPIENPHIEESTNEINMGTNDFAHLEEEMLEDENEK
jgi:hypothetical protein